MLPLWPLLWSIGLAASTENRPRLIIDPTLTCPSPQALRDALERSTARGDELLSVQAEPDGRVRVEWLNAGGERIATRRFDPATTSCAELVQTITLLAEAWAQAFPEGSLPPPAPADSESPPAEVSPPPVRPTPPAESPPPPPAVVAAPPPPAPPTPKVAAPSAVGPGFHPGPLFARLAGVGALDFTSGPSGLVPGFGGELALELGLGRSFGVGGSATLLSNAAITVADPQGSVLLHRQRYSLFGSYRLAGHAQWLELQLGVDLSHILSVSSGYQGATEQDTWVPGVAISPFYAHTLWGPLFGFAALRAALFPAQAFLVNQRTPRQETLFTLFPLSLDGQLGVGVQFL